MILRQIGEHRRIVNAALHPILIQGMGGNLHHPVGAALGHHQGQHALQIIGIRRGVAGGQDPIPYHILYGADEAHLIAAGLHNRFKHIGGGGLAVGAGDAHQPQAVGGMAEPGGAHLRPGFPGGFHQELAGQSHVLFRYDGRGPGLGGLPGELMSVYTRARNADKCPARLHPARIAGYPCYLHVPAGRDGTYRGQQL